jgi:hypothetical protein
MIRSRSASKSRGTDSLSSWILWTSRTFTTATTSEIRKSSCRIGTTSASAPGSNVLRVCRSYHPPVSASPGVTTSTRRPVCRNAAMASRHKGLPRETRSRLARRVGLLVRMGDSGRLRGVSDCAATTSVSAMNATAALQASRPNLCRVGHVSRHIDRRQDTTSFETFYLAETLMKRFCCAYLIGPADAGSAAPCRPFLFNRAVYNHD